MSKISVISFFIILGIAFSSSQIHNEPSPAQQVKDYYLAQTRLFINDLENFKKSISTGHKKNIQQKFLAVRESYKKAETLIEYYFNFFAVQLNGAPIPYFEEDDPDKGQLEPAGMQVIEAIIFPVYNIAQNEELLTLTDKLIRDAQTMLETNESFAFNDEFITDAVIEELYRIAALGIAGFDAQLSGNGLPECKAALAGVQNILLNYEENFKISGIDKFNRVHNLFKEAVLYLERNNSFDAFNRLDFIQNYLTPITKEVTAFKLKNNFKSNKSGRFYCTIKKENSLFAPNNFNVNKYLDDNTTSPYKIELGRMLFFDTQLSVDNKRSCATCHQPNKAFTDGLKTSVALDGHSALPRNAPTLWNVALQRNLFLDNRSRTLEDQVMQVLNNKKEMHGSAQAAAEKIIKQKEYENIYAKAYQNAPLSEAANNICNAIACFERTLIALNAKFDRHMNGQKTLSVNEINGFNLFMGKAKCGTCHFAPLFNGSKPPRYYFTESEVIGTPQKNVKQHAVLDNDEGRYAITGLPMHKFAFKTPTLRNVALTAPYMHNGVFTTLEQVVDFYNEGGGKGLKIDPPNQTLPFDRLNLSKKEKKDLVLFMRSLTDTSVAD
jgi:cytochrome c peroxidase